MIKWNEVTWYSKLGAAIVLFVLLPALSFYIGTKYDERKDEESKEVFLQQFYKTRTEQKMAANKTDTSKNEDTSISPTGNRLYSKEDAVASARAHGLWGRVVVTRWFALGYFPHDSHIKLIPAVKTGDGMAWVIEDWDPSKSAKEECGSQGAEIYVRARFEMNEKTGVVEIEKKCRLAFFD